MDVSVIIFPMMYKELSLAVQNEANKLLGNKKQEEMRGGERWGKFQ